MPIGVIISSSNLSGLTANVTFYPFSGGSVNVGTVTIPFNYLSTNPYGTYSIYVPSYNYTYTLIVNEPSPSNTQSFTWLSTPPLNNIWVRAILNYNDLTAEIIQFTNLPTSEWNCGNLHPITEKGYGYYFYKISNNDNRYVVFTDSFGNIVGEYSGITSSYDEEYLDGHYSAFIDYDNGVIAYSDGQNYNEFYWNSGDISFQAFENTYSSISNFTTKNGSMVIRLYDNSNNEILWYLLRPTSSELLESLPDDGSYSYYYINNYCSFIQKISKTGDTFTDITILEDVSGTTIDITILSADTYDSSYVYFYGYNKIGNVLYNDSDSDIEWFIHTFDRNTNSAVLDTHLRGSDYLYFSSPSTSPNEYNDVTPGDNFYCLFYNTNFNFIYKLGYEVSYLEIMSLFSGNSSFTTTIYQDSGIYDKYFYFNFSCGNDLITLCSTGDSYTTIYTLTNTGVNFIPTQYYDDFSNLNIFRFGDRVVFINRDGEVSNDANLYLIGGNELLDTLYLIPANGSFDYITQWGLFMYYDNEQNNYYVNETVDNFVEIDTFTDSYSSSRVYWGLGYQIRTIATVNNNNGQVVLLNYSMKQGPFTLPINGGTCDGYNLEIGRDKLLYVYKQPTWSGNYTINLYDFDFNLVFSEDTNYTNTWEVTAAKDRYYLIYQNPDNNNYTLTLISNSLTQSVDISDYNSNRTINDFTYWYQL